MTYIIPSFAWLLFATVLLFFLPDLDVAFWACLVINSVWAVGYNLSRQTGRE